MCWRGCLPTETLLWQVNKALIRHDLALICERRANDRVYRNQPCFLYHSAVCFSPARVLRSEEHTSELQSLMRISYAVFCLKTKTQIQTNQEFSQYNSSNDNKMNKYTN